MQITFNAIVTLLPARKKNSLLFSHPQKVNWYFLQIIAFGYYILGDFFQKIIRHPGDRGQFWTGFRAYVREK
jgi:hypothetical protein